jgi:predicted dehydrogenase
MNSPQLRVGIVGLGLIGRKRLLALPSECVLVGVHDSQFDVAEAVAAEFSITSFSKLSELLDSIGPGGLAIIATPHNFLFGIAENALFKNINVFIEKPGSINAGELEILITLAEARKCIIRIGYNHRFHPGVLKAKSIISSNSFGPVQFIRARYGHGGRKGYELEWRADRVLSGGGELIDQGSHLIDLSQYFVGDMFLEFSDIPTLYWDVDVEDNAILYGAFRRGGKFLLHASWTEWKNIFSFEIFMKTAKIELFGLGGSYGQETFTLYEMPGGLGVPITSTQVFPPADASWELEMQDTVNEIVFGTGQGASGLDALKVLQIIGQAYTK